MAQQPPTVLQQIAQLTSRFPMSAADKNAAIALAFRDVDLEAIAAVHAALDIAIPLHAWNAAHATDPACIAEHAVEQGRHDVVDSLASIIANKTKKPE